MCHLLESFILSTSMPGFDGGGSKAHEHLAAAEGALAPRGGAFRQHPVLALIRGHRWQGEEGRGGAGGARGGEEKVALAHAGWAEETQRAAAHARH
eukprot:gene207-biopygen5